MYAKFDLNPPQESFFDSNCFQVSMQNLNTENICVVTGPNTFYYLKVAEDNLGFETRNALTAEQAESGDETFLYTCHTRTKEH